MLSACFAFVPAAFGQDAINDTRATEKVEEIVVTGSHIRRTDYDGPQPIVVFDRAYLENTGFQNLAEFSRYLPQSHQTFNEGSGQYGGKVAEASQFNLRGLGADSTLTLVNGLRVAPYGQSMWGDPFADTSAIPMSMIERIEILKDGASAIYGADAVAGVVNIILKDDFVGTEVAARYQVTSRGDNAEWNVDLYHGGQKGAFNYLLGFFYQDRDPLYNRDRKHSADPDFTPVGGYNFRSFNSAPSTIFRYDTFATEPDPACGTNPLISDVADDPDYPGETVCAFNYNQFDMMFIERQRASISLKAGYEFDNGMHLFGDLLFSRKDTFDQLAQTPIAGALLDTILGRPIVLEDHPENPFGVPLEILYRVFDAGPRQKDVTSKQYRATFGLEGDAGRWYWRATILDSGSRVEKDNLNSILLPAFQEAVLGRGGPNQDQYYNPFGWMPENDPAVIAEFTMTTAEGSDSREQAAEISASTTFGELPGGPVGLVLGAQWRYQELEEWADDILAQGLIAGTSADFLIPHAEREIGSVYAELSLPLFDSLELQVAARYENYSDFGSTTNPKLALRWEPFEQLALRASWGTSFHAPDFMDLYSNPVEFFWFFTDTPRCEVTGADADCEPAIYEVLDQGNPDLQPETGDSLYAGIVWSPAFATGLQAEVGFWRIDYEDRIWWVDPQYVLDNLPADTPYIERAPQTPDEAAAGIPGRIVLVHSTFQNVAEQHTQGWDVDIGYQWTTNNAHEFDVRLDYTYTDTWDVVFPEAFGMVEESLAGRYWDGPIPRNRGNLSLGWRRQAHNLSGTVRYSGHYENWMEFVPVDGEESDIPFIVDGHVTFDLQYGLEMDRLRGATMRVGCQNCSDEDPPFTHDTLGEDIHDRRGLIWYANWSQPF